MLILHTVKAVHHEIQILLANTPWKHPLTILELKYVHIAPLVDSYVNAKTITLISLFVGFVQVEKWKTSRWDTLKPLNTAAGPWEFTWALD